MKIALWKSGMLGLAFGLLLAMGAFAEGTIGLLEFGFLAVALVRGVRFACAQMERCEAEAAARRSARPMRAQSRSVRQPAPLCAGAADRRAVEARRTLHVA
jgi:hypothetical protein